MKLKIGIIAVTVCFVSMFASASLYTFNDVGYSYSTQENWSDLTGAGNPSIYSGHYMDQESSWSSAISAEDGSSSFNKTGGAGYLATEGVYGSVGSGSYAVSGSAAGAQSVVLVIQGGGSEYAALITDNNGQVRGGTKTGLRKDFAYAGQYGPVYTHLNAYQFSTAGMDLSSYDVSFSAAPHHQVTGLQLETANSYAAIPEPATMGFMGLSAAGLFVLRRLRIIA